MSLFVDFAGLNTLIQDAVTSSANYIGYPLTEDVSSYYNPQFPLANNVDYLAALNLHRNGPYGYSTFRQLRVSHNNLSRYQRKNNSFSIINEPSLTVNTSKTASDLNYVASRYGDISRYIEMPIIDRYKPLRFKFGVGIDNKRLENKQGPLSVPNIETVILLNSFGNEINFFSSEELNRKVNLKTLTDEEYEVIKNFYLNGGLDADDSPISTFIHLVYSENLYPREINKYRHHIRQRTNYANSYWRSSRSDRHTTQYPSGFDGEGNILASIWSLDVDQDWPTLITSSDDPDAYNSGRAIGASGQRYDNGILQNNRSIFFKTTGFYSSVNLLSTLPIYNRQHAIHHSKSVVSPNGIEISETGTVGSAGPAFGGFAKWEAGDQSGLQPFYDTIDKFYSEDLKVRFKDYSILPEYRSSRFVDQFYENGSGEYIPDNFLETSGGLSGSNLSSEDQFYDVYSTTEFFKNFAQIKKDHKGFVDPSMITLTCKAVKKFVPYNSFYPSERTVDLAREYWNSFSPYVSSSTFSTFFGDLEFGKNNFMVPLFSPGVLFNSIKAGVACDYPLSSQTSSLNQNRVRRTGRTLNGKSEYFITGEFDKRVPFEALLEPQSYLANYRILNQEPHPSGSVNNGSVVWNGGGKTIFNIKASNFCAEVADFFLQDGIFTKIESNKQGSNKFGILQSGSTYTMRVKMYRSMTGPNYSVLSDNAPTGGAPYDTVDYFYIPPQDVPSGPNSSFFNDGAPRETMTMYSRPSAFGPAVCAASSTSGIANFSASSANGYNFPFTPPYYHGQSWAHISYTADRDGKHTIDEIIAGATTKYYRVDPATWAATEIAAGGFNSKLGPLGVTSSADLNSNNYHLQKVNTNAMQLSASLNLFNIQDSPNSKTARTSNNPSLTTGDAKWVIQTKFETPILNFNNVDVTTSSLDAQTPRGMWHQYGVNPTGDQGIYLEVEDVPNNWYIGAEGLDQDEVKNNYKSLADVCGFSKRPIRLGETRDRKEVSEAIVAIPFTELNGEKKFFELESLNGSQVLRDMVTKMQKYVLPPQFDFVKNKDITPFSMYIFEFFHQFDREDLTNMWQGLYPKISREFKEATSSISHPLLAKELLGTGIKEDNRKIGSTLPDKIRWLVFKIKKRANHNYYSKIVGSNKEVRGLSDYVTPNWPYDYFSLIELAKLDGEIKFSEIAQKGSIVRDITLGDSTNEKSSRNQIFSDVGTAGVAVVATDPNAGTIYDDGPDVPPPIVEIEPPPVDPTTNLPETPDDGDDPTLEGGTSSADAQTEDGT